MTDGPFKNLELGNCWKQLAEAVQNNAASLEECGVVACDALTRHLVTKEHVKALQVIEEHIGQGQLELDPLGSVETIFEQCARTPFLNALQKELSYRVSNYTPLGDARAPAIVAAIKTQIGETRNRFHEECIRALEDGEMSREAADQARQKINVAFEAVDCEEVCCALLEGRNNAFEKDLGRGDDVDEGMVWL